MTVLVHFAIITPTSQHFYITMPVIYRCLRISINIPHSLYQCTRCLSTPHLPHPSVERLPLRKPTPPPLCPSGGERDPGAGRGRDDAGAAEGAARGAGRPRLPRQVADWQWQDAGLPPARRSGQSAAGHRSRWTCQNPCQDRSHVATITPRT